MLSFLFLAAAGQAELAQLDQLAANHDVVAIVQQVDIQYQKVREFPNKGYGELRVLIGYKGIDRGTLIEVHEEGLEEYRCYYPDFENEGNRYLVFLNHVKNDRFSGTLPACRIPVLVTADNKYALQYPVDGIELDADLAQEIDFADPAAYVELADLTFEETSRLTDAELARIEETDAYGPAATRLVYTHGIPVDSLRDLLFPPVTDEAP